MSWRRVLDRTLWRRPADDMAHLPRRLPVRAWVLGWSSFVLIYGFMWTYVHAWVDTRACVGHIPDPLFDVIPFDVGWYAITTYGYVSFLVVAGATVLVQAFLGEHRVGLRWLFGLAYTGVQRIVTLALIPLCRWNVIPGQPAKTRFATLDLGFVQIPWNQMAKNDLLFSGHVAAYFLLFRATRTWPPVARGLLLCFLVAMSYGLVATRGHYTIDVLLAFPCSYLGDRLAVLTVERLSRRGGAIQKET